MNAIGRAFESTDPTQNVAVTASSQTITLSRKVPDTDGCVLLTNIGTQTVFVRLDGTTPTVSIGIPIMAGTAQTFSMPVGALTVKAIAAATGSTLYVSPGRGV